MDDKDSTPPQGRNGWDFLTNVFNGLLGLFNNNKIYPAVLLVVMIMMLIIAVRLPASDLADIIKTLISELIVSKGSLIAFIILSNGFWVYMNRRQERNFKQELERMAEMRSELLHNPSRKTIKKHRSTNDDCQEKYMIPGRELTDEEKKKEE